MAKIKDLLNRAANELQNEGRLSKSARMDIVSEALKGEQFEVRVNYRDYVVIRSRMSYYGKSGICHCNTQPDGTALLSFNK